MAGPNSRFSLFGFTISKDVDQDTQPSFTAPTNDDGAITITGAAHYGVAVDLENTTKNDIELISRYREMAMQPELESAIDDIVNEAICQDDDGKIIQIVLDDLKQPTKIKEAIKEEFNTILKLLNYTDMAQDIFRRYYIDGRLYYHVIVDKENPTAGVLELRYIDPRKLKKVREVKKQKDERTGAEVVNTVNEYYTFNDKVSAGSASAYGPVGTRITTDSIVSIVSGLMDARRATVLSFLHKCITGDGRIKTPSGWTAMRDIEVGDSVYALNTKTKEIEETKVTNKWNNGYKDIVVVRSKHTQFKCTTDHPIYVYDKKIGDYSYVEAGNLIPKRHQITIPKTTESFDDIKFPETVRETKLSVENPELWCDVEIKGKKKIIHKIADDLGQPRAKIYSFVYGYQSLSVNLAESVISMLPIKLTLKSKLEGYCLNKLSLPEYVDEDFAKLFGFLIGDGWVNKYTVGFAEGDKPHLNEIYHALMVKYFGNCSLVVGKTRVSKYNSYYSNNTLGAELMKQMGFITGATKKRIPEWVFKAKNSIKIAFIQGLMDADGSKRDNLFSGRWSYTTNLANENLIKDIKEIWTSVGYSSGKIYTVKQRPTTIFGKEVKHFSGAWSITLTKTPLELTESVFDVTAVDGEEVFDIEVEHEDHNFIVNGAVVHNCIRPLNQLRMIEDATVIYRICLVGDTRVKTNTGYKYIKDIKSNDIVYSFNAQGIFEAPVKSAWSNGIKPVYKVKSKHHSITGTATHPVLVYDEQTKVVEYIDIEKIDTTKHSFVWETTQEDSIVNSYDLDLAEKVGELLEAESISGRIPQWVFTAPTQLKLAFIFGLNCVYGKEEHIDELACDWSNELRLPSVELAEDIKELWTSTGYASTHITEGKNERVCFWSITLSNIELNRFEKISSVEYVGEEEVFDLEVDSEKHNFVANGVVVHNSRAPERRIFYIDVGNLPKLKAEQYLRDIMVKYKNKLVYDANTGEIRDDRKFLSMMEDFWLPRREGGKGTEITTLPGGCFAMDTKVSLLDGRELSIKDIEEEMKTGKELWTYSCHPKTGEIVPGLISWAGVTHEKAKVMRITLDNGESFVCTPDHKFPIYGQEFKRAMDFTVGESLIPLYRRKEIIAKGKNNKYEQYFDNSDKKWKFTHRMVAEYLKDSVVNYSVYNEEISNGSYDARHHIDCNRFNNDPQNLCFMSWEDFRVKESVHNHRVVKIEYLDDEIQVGTLTIDGNEEYHDYHTFALQCGILCFNSNLGELKDLEFFEKKLYKSLNVPISRLDPQSSGFSLGRSGEITRDELKFSKFVGRMRAKFSDLFDQCLRVQCVLKGICTDAEWKDFKEHIHYSFIKDNNFTELKEAELMKERLSLLQEVDPYTGRYFSQAWIQRNVLRLTDDEIEKMESEIEEEKEAGMGLPVSVMNDVSQQQMMANIGQEDSEHAAELDRETQAHAAKLQAKVIKKQVKKEEIEQTLNIVKRVLND